MAEDNKPKLNASAASFSFSAGASSWTPSFAAAPAPAPAAAAVVDPVVEALIEPVEQIQVQKPAVPAALEETTPKPSSSSKPRRRSPSPAPAASALEEDLELKESEIKEEDPRQHINIVFIGHVDAGKSTLSGNILYLMDMVDKRTIERYEKEAKERNRESWFLAFIMDTGEEERAKGKTVEVGRAHFETANKRFTMLDAPGHKNYVPNMIQGASQADAAVLVISARKGEFETGFDRGGQTREHAMLAKTLGVNKLVVVINKMDEPNWSEERYNECVGKLKPFLKSCGYAVKRNVTFIPISGLTGDNVKDKLATGVAPWYTGDALLDIFDKIEIPGRDRDGPLRVPVLDRYQERGTMAMGKVEAGVLRTGAKVVLLPTNTSTLVQQVYINDEPVRTAKPGENVKIKLACGTDDLMKGFVICDPESPIAHVKSFCAKIHLVDLLPHRPLFCAGYKAILHVHALAEECQVVELLRQVDKKTGKVMKKKCTFVREGDIVICRLRVEQSVSIDTFENMPQMGRFTLRDEGKSIGVGMILKLDDLDTN